MVGSKGPEGLPATLGAPSQIFQFLTFIEQTKTCFLRISDFVKAVTGDPAKAVTSFSKVNYEGSVASLPGGAEGLRAMLAALVDRAEKDAGWQKGAREEVKAMYRKAAAGV